MSYSEVNFLFLLLLINKSFMFNPLDCIVPYSRIPNRYYV